MKINNRTIMIVEDESKIAQVVQSYLETKGYTVVIADTGGQALQLMEQQNILLILLDLMLPDISGEEICISIRQQSRVPIIMLTAKIEEESMLQGLQIGADDYITKPFSLKTLHARIEAVLRRSAHDLTPLFSRKSWGEGDLEIDFSSHLILKNKMTINLTASEYKILTTLIKYPNRIFTREDLIATAFHGDFDGYDRVIDSHIKNIRQKIESDPKKPVYILTAHGIGYKFCTD